MSRLTRSNNDKSKLCRFGYVDYIVLASSLAVANPKKLMLMI
ncbi:hypothetical protein H477_0535 [[Clostridium] sordellii ATCC 9714]|nr:hypothetical protein H477_0535 [[Clostridium] sordellii ATCC 9714] [Paeniclostridium sordellii ATCC 9714]